MRAMKWMLGLGAALAAAGVVGTGCGDDTNNNNPADSGSDVATDHTMKDGAMEAAQEASGDDGGMMCMSDADLTMIMVPDSGLPDAGGVNLAVCVSCLEMNCKSDLEACNMECKCHDGIVNALPCVQQMGLSINCVSGLLTDPAAMKLAGCAISNCGAGICQPMPSQNDAGDGGGDAANEAGDDGSSDASDAGGG